MVSSTVSAKIPMPKLLPIGISDYKKRVEGGYYYVDKTERIHESGIAAKSHW